MKRFLQHLYYILIFIGILVPTIAKADSWLPAHIRIYYSENKEYKLIITPKITSKKYDWWYYYKSNDHPQTKKVLRKKERFMRNIKEQDTIFIPCTAELYRISKTDSILIWQKPLLNEIGPVDAIVANNGSSVVTFDNWYSRGHGENVFVVYDENGEAKMSYELKEISPFPLNDYKESKTSIHWYRYGNIRFIDNERIEIIFVTREDIQRKRVYNVKGLEFENEV